MNRKYFSLILLSLILLAVSGCKSGMISEIKNHVRTDAPIERKFMKPGQFSPKCFIASANDFKLKEYRVWYPAELEEKNGKTFPLLIFCNATGYRALQADSFFKHLASWGFVVVGTDEKWSGKGRGAILSLRFLLGLNQKKESLFYGKINSDRIGIIGYSQGGAGAINAVTKYSEGKRFKALFSISGIRQEVADTWLMRCPYDPGKVKIPVMMTATSNPYGWDEANPERSHLAICPLYSMKKNRDSILKNHDTIVVIARVANKKKYHADNPALSAPYLTAWFSYWLKNDSDAGKFFLGKNPELKQNPGWQDVEISRGRRKVPGN